MRELLARWKHILGILSIPMQGYLYVWISHHAGSNRYLDYGWVDTKIPFVDWFVLPYMSWMPVLYASFLYLAITNRKIYWRTLASYNIAVMVCNLCFWVFPTYVPRPSIDSSSFIFGLVADLYRADAPYNCFPSIHCLTSYLLFITLNRQIRVKTPLRIIGSVWLWLIIASTMLIKQHSLLDAIGGIVLAEIVYRVVYYAFGRNRVQEQPVVT